MHARRPFKEAKSLFRLLCCCLIISLKCFLGIDRVLELDGWIRVFCPSDGGVICFSGNKDAPRYFPRGEERALSSLDMFHAF